MEIICGKGMGIFEWEFSFPQLFSSHEIFAISVICLLVLVHDTVFLN